MTGRLDPRTLHPDSLLFLDYVAGVDRAVRLFARQPTGFAAAADAIAGSARPRIEVADAVRTYNERLGASPAALDNARALADPATLCVVGGQQAGFLGGPAYTAYKILSIVRLATKLSRDLDARVIPVFWLASEDHDVTEINRIRLLDADGSIRTIRFETPARGRAVESLPISPDIVRAADEALARLPAGVATRELFAPQKGDDYSRWHGRIWSRLFADDGLVLVEPRTLRSLAGGFFRDALARADEVTNALEAGSDAVRAAGYAPQLESGHVGTPFHFDASGRRIRVEAPADRAADALIEPERYSADVALRPVLTDALLPTVANILGPSEIAYHALLRPLYEMFEVSQPVAVPRHGYTLLSADEAQLLNRLDLSVEQVYADDFDPRAALAGAASPPLREAFTAARRDVASALAALPSLLREIDPGLEARWRQTSQRADQAINRLEDHAIRADLARRTGASAKRLHALRASLRPSDVPQERGLSLVHFVGQFGVEWIRALPGSESPDRFAHHVVTIQGGT